LIKHAYENTQYYYELMQDLNLTPANIKTIDDLHILPILTKEAFRDNFRKGKIIAQNINKGEMILYSSIGSTGKPLQYFITKNAYSFSRACGVREWYWMGLISDNHTTRTTTNRIPVFFRGLVDYPGQGGLDGNRSTSEEINGT